VDIHPEAAAILCNFIGNRKSGFLSQTSNGTMFAPSCIARDSFDPILQEIDRAQAGTRFNIFRPFREALLRRSDARQLIIDSGWATQTPVWEINMASDWWRMSNSGKSKSRESALVSNSLRRYLGYVGYKSLKAPSQRNEYPIK
jgi:hypothetical protein